MAGTFIDRTDMLAAQVGAGPLVGKVEVNQVYAQNQHESTEFNHPDGGKDHFLRDPLFERSMQYGEKLAHSLITENGSDIVQGMIDVVEDLSLQVFVQAPVEFGDRKASGHPTVTDDGQIVYDRPPNMHRLSEEELREKSKISHLFWPSRYLRSRKWR